MKRNELLAKSLTLGLAVATAATSMSVPGGLLAPETVYAGEESNNTDNTTKSEGETTEETGAEAAEATEESTTEGQNEESQTDGEDSKDTEKTEETEDKRTVLSADNIKEYMEYTDGLISVNSKDGTAAVSGLHFTAEYGWNDEKYGQIKRTYCNEDDTPMTGAFEIGKTYNVYVNVDGSGTELAAAEKPIIIGKAIAYENWESEGYYLKCKDGESGEAIEMNADYFKPDAETNDFKYQLINDAILIAPDGMKISTTLEGDYTSKVTISRGELLGGGEGANIYAKLDSQPDKVYAKNVHVYFKLLDDGETRISGTAKLSSTVKVGETLTASVENGAQDATYQYMFIREKDGKEEVAQESGDSDSYEITKDDIGFTIKVVVTTKTQGVVGELVSAATEAVPKIVVDTTNIKDYVDYTDIEAGTLTYNGENQSEAVRETIEVKEDCADDTEITGVSFKKEAQDTDFVGAGTYDVYVELEGNYATSEPVKIGTAVIDKYQPKVDDIVVLNQTQTYAGEEIKAKVTSSYYLLDDDKVQLTYKQNDQDVEAPTNAGTYNIYVGYEGDDNCAALAATDKGSTLTIEKATVNSSPIPTKVVKNDTDNEIECDLSDAVNDWTLSGTDKNVEATVTVDRDCEKYIESLKYDSSSKKVTFKLTDDGKALKENKEFSIHVDFGESFTNYNVSFDLPVIITDKTPVDISISGDTGLTYDGKAKELAYKITSDAAGFNDSENTPTTVTITKDGTKVEEIKDAGTYVVTAEYDEDDYYGKLVQEIIVAPKQITSTEDLQKCFTLGELNLTYDMGDHKAAIIDAVKTIVASGIESGDYDYDVSITGDTTNAGTVQVSVNTWGGNYYTDDYVELGEVTIGKGALTLNVTANSKGTPTITVGDKTIANDDSHVSIEYFKGDDSLGNTAPTAAGTYTVKVTYTDTDNLTAEATGKAAFTISGSSSGGNTSGGNTSGGSTSGGSSSSSGSSSDASQDSKKDDTIKTETKADGTVVSTTETKADDGSVQTKIDLKNDKTGVDATVNVAKDAQGNVTSVTAEATQKSADQTTEISAAVVAQITEAAGTKDVAITTKTVDENGKTVREVTVNAANLTAGKKLKIVATDPKTGKKTLVNNATYKVAADGSLALDNLDGASYELITTAAANSMTKEILKTIKPEKTKTTVAAGKKSKLTLDDALDMDNVSKITYKTGKKSVATVNANGTITTKKAGKVTIKAIVTLNNGKKKTVKMTLTVKPQK